MKFFRFLFLISFMTLLSCELNAQVYYWVGGSGNWTDINHWSNTSNGTPNAGVAPTANSIVVFDANSFNALGQAVTIDTSYINVKAIRWSLDSTESVGVSATTFYNPTFSGLSSADSIKVNGTFLLHPQMNYSVNASIRFTGGANDSIVSAGKTFGGNLIIDTYGNNLKITDNITTTGKFIYKRGGLYLDNVTLNCLTFDSNFSGTKNLYADNTIFNLSGQDTVLLVKPMTTLNDTNFVFNITNTTTQNTLYIGMGGINQKWGTLNLQNKNIRFVTDSYFDTINGTSNMQKIEIVGGRKLKSKIFTIDGNCGKYISFRGLSNTNISTLDNLTDWNLDYFKIQNLRCNLATPITATNTIDLGNNQNWTITADNTAPIAMYWIGGQGDFYDGQHWSYTSGGIASNCIPTPNDTVYFDAPSFNTIGDTLFLNENVRVATMNFSGIDVNIVASGTAGFIELSKNIFGSGNILFNWSGQIRMTGTTACTLQTGAGGLWNGDFVKTGAGSLTLLDDFNSNKNFTHSNGLFNTNGNSVTLFSFVSSSVSLTRNINFLNSVLNVKGTEFNVSATNLTIYHTTGSTFNFLGDSLYTIFTPGTDSLHSVRLLNGTSVQIEGSSVKYHSLLEIKPGSTLVLKNLSQHEFHQLNAIGNCDSLVTIKSLNTTYGGSTLGHKTVWSNILDVDYAVIDNVTAGLGSPYLIGNSFVSPTSQNWASGTALTTVSVGFLIAAPNDTISQGETSPLILSATNLVIPAGVSVISSVLTLDGVQTTGSTTLDECNVAVSGASTLASLALIPPTISTIQLNTSTSAGANGVVNLTLSQDPGPAGNFILDTAFLTVTYFTPYVPVKDTLYWFGGTGNWTDVSHWSHNSGNIPPDPATCLPSVGDHLIFDDLSFSADDQSVTVDNNSYFASMTWASVDDSVFLKMAEDLTASESVTWSPFLSINKGSGAGKFKFQPNDTTATFNQNNAQLDVSIEFISLDLNDTLSLINNVNNGDFNSIIVFGGVLNTNDNDIHSNSLLITSAFTPSVVNLGSSTIELIAGYADYAGDSSIVNSGTSAINIDHSDLVNTNYFRGNDQTFNKVILNFNPINYSVVTGSNVFDTLIVEAGSKLTIDALSNNTINSVFTMLGNCLDSISLQSSGLSNYTFTSSAVLDAMCLNVKNSTATPTGAGTFTTYFSTNISGNTGSWVFDASVSTTAILDAISNFCFGDTVSFVNNSTAYLNDMANLTSIWNFGDGATFEGDTTLHYYNYPGEYQLQLVTQYSNLCTDTLVNTIEIFAPSVSLLSSINDTLVCAEQMISFFASSPNDIGASSYEFIINGTPTSVPTIGNTQLDTLNLPNPSDITVNLYENGCSATSDTIQMYVIPLDVVTLSVPSTTICAGQSVTFTPGGTNVYQYFKNGIAITPFTALPYTTSTIVNGDQFYAIGRNNTTLCADTSNILVFTVNALPTITSVVSSDLNNIICSIDTVTFTVTSPTATSYQYYVNSVLYANSASNQQEISPIPNGGQVTVIVQNAQGCSSQMSAPITHLVNPTPTVTLASTSPSGTICENANVLFTSTSANLYQYSVNGVPVGPFSTNAFYESDTLNNNDVITVAGSSFGCIGYASDTLTFTVIDLPVTTISSNIGNSICAGQTAVVTANSAIATNFEFFLNGNSIQNGALNTYSFNSLTNGALVTVIGSESGCSYSTNLTFTVFNNPNPTIFTNDANNIICEGQNITITGTGANTYEYFINGVSTFTGTGPYTTDSLAPGTNNISILATNTVTGCAVSTNTIIVTATELPITNLTSTSNVICSGETITFTATSAVADLYQFFVNSVSQGLPTSNNTFTSSTLPNGAIIFVRGYNDGCVNPGLDTLTIVVNPNPVASLTGATVFCENAAQVYNGSSTLTGSAFEFFVDGISQSTSSTFDASGLPAGNYSLELIVTSPNGCTDNVLNNISVLENPNVVLSGDATICSGQSVTFTGTGALNYQYFVNGTPTSTTSIFTTNTLINGDVVTLTGSTGAGCSSSSPTPITMIVAPSPVVTLLSDDFDNTLCTGNTVNFTANGATNYEFFVNGISQGPPTTNNSFSTSALTNGQTVTVEGDLNGCIDQSGGITFSVSNSPVVSLSNLEDTVLCSDTQTQLIANGATDYLFYVNGVPQGVFNPTNTLNILLNDGDIVTVEGMTNTCVSGASDSFAFSVFSYPTTSLTSSDPDNTICFGDEVTFTGSGATDYEYFIDGLSLGISGSIFITDQLLDGQVITLIGYNSECSTDAPQTLTYTVNTLDISSTTNPSNFMVCEGSPFEIQASGADEYELFVNNVSQGAQSTTNTFTLNGLNNNDIITLNGYSASTGCVQSDDATIYIQVFDEPTITNNGPNVFCEGDSVILYSNSSYGNQWFMDGAAITGATDTFLVVQNTGNYSLEITQGGFGELWSVGYNANGEFGDGTNLNNVYPSIANTLTDIAAISSGTNHTMVVDGAGQLFVFGDNSSGQLGNGTFTASNTPVIITTVPTVSDVAAGENSSVIVTTTGEIFTWGDNTNGQLGLGNTNVFNTPQWVVGITGVSKVAAGKTHFLALKNDGTVWSVGNNDFGQLGTGTLNSSNVFTQIAGLSNIVKISSGDYHSMAIDNAGSLYVWGNNSSGQLGLNDLDGRTTPTLSNLTNVSAVSGGNAHTVMLTSNNRVYTAGANNFGQLGTGNFTLQDSPTYLQDIDAVVEVAAGRHHTLFRKNDGTIWGAGRNDNKQLGDLPLASTPVITKIPNVEGVTLIDGGNQSSHFIYGNSAICTSVSELITVTSAPLPVITFNGSVLSTADVGISYEWFIDNISVINSNSATLIPSEDGEYTVAVTYANGCTRLSNVFTYPVIVGNPEINLSSIVLYPNPTNGKFIISWNGELNVQFISLYDMTGKLLTKDPVKNEEENFVFDLSNYSDGIYRIWIETENGTGSSLKVIKH
jgi:alpha-tubulin suppressor-like RCC1 family protein